MMLDKLGDIETQKRHLKKASNWYEKNLAIWKQLAEETKTVEAYDDLAVSYCKLAWVVPEKKQEYLTKAYEIWKSLAEHCPHVEKYARRRDIVLSDLQG